MSFQNRVLLAMGLCALIWSVFDLLAPPPPVSDDGGAELGAELEDGTGDGSGSASGSDPGAAEPGREPEAAPESPQEATPEVPVETHRVENGALALELTNATPQRGGLIGSNELLGPPFAGHETARDWLQLGDRRTLEVSFADASTEFRLPREANFEVVERGARVFVQRYGSSEVEIIERFELLDGYEAKLVVSVTNRGDRAQVHRMHLRTRMGQPGEASRYDVHRALCRTSEELEELTESDLEDGAKTFAGPVRWGGVDSKYFGTLVVPAAPMGQCVAEVEEAAVEGGSEGAVLAATLSGAEVTLEPGQQHTYTFGVFVGAKKLEQLEAFGAVDADGVNLGEAIDWGWFGGLSAGLGRLMLQLMRWFYEVTGVWGVAILLLTLAVKLVTLPLTLKQMNSMKRTKEIQPEMDAIRKKYGDDKAKQAQEMQALFSRSGVNPLAGCLPMLVQFPIWIALYSMLNSATELVHVPFLWLPDLTKSDPYLILPLALGGMMVVQSRMTPSSGMDPTQQKMMQWMMPTMFTFFMLFLPSGLALYIFANIVLSVIQTAIQMRTRTPAKSEAT